MAFRLHCDRCLIFLEVVDAKKMKSLASSGGETVCNSCAKTEAKLNREIERIRAVILEKTKAIEDDIKRQLADQLKTILDDNKRERLTDGEHN